MIDERWEQGSEFAWQDFGTNQSAIYPWSDKGLLFGSGRDAFRSLICFGQHNRGWKRLWIPSYFCQEVASALMTTMIDLCVYAEAPGDELQYYSGIGIRQNDVFLKINLFGIGKIPDYSQLRLQGIEVIEDHTHDIGSDWAWKSSADWCVASLRKVLPVPDGGVIWSPVNCELPQGIPATDQRKTASLSKMAGMVLKSQYLSGHNIEKDVFRRLLLEGEDHIADGEISGMTEWTRNLIKTFPVDEWRQRKLTNYKVLCEKLRGIPLLKVLNGSTSSNCCPFSAILLFDSQKQKDYVRTGLIDANIYPAVLWSLDEPEVKGIPDEHIKLSRRMLSIHCDMRYDEKDMQNVANVIRKLGVDCN